MGCERLLPVLSSLLRRSLPPEVVDSKQMDGADSSLALPPHSTLYRTSDDAVGGGKSGRSAACLTNVTFRGGSSRTYARCRCRKQSPPVAVPMASDGIPEQSTVPLPPALSTPLSPARSTRCRSSTGMSRHGDTRSKASSARLPRANKPFSEKVGNFFPTFSAAGRRTGAAREPTPLSQPCANRRSRGCRKRFPAGLSGRGGEGGGGAVPDLPAMPRPCCRRGKSA